MIPIILWAVMLSSDPPVSLADVTESSGLQFVTTSGAVPSTHILEVKGGGVALIDFDEDGDEDLFFPNGATLAAPESGPGARLYENLGGLRFADATARMGVAFRRWGFGVASGDIDGNGHEDLFIACLGQDVLLLGQGGGRFVDATADWLPPDDDWNTGAALADIDLDGDLDLYVCGYVKVDPAAPLPAASFKGIPVLAGPRGYVAEPDRLLLNEGGRFVDHSEALGIRAGPDRFALNVVALDVSGDGRIDLFVGNDSQPDSLWVNDGTGHFNDRGAPSGASTNLEGSGQATMGIAVGDVDANGFPDLLTTNFSSDTNTLHLNLDGGFLDDRTSQYGIGAPSRTWCGWGASFVDLDHDGDEDLVGVNGHVYPQATRELMDSEYRQPLMVMERMGPRFVARDSGLGSHVDRSMVATDLDGDLDVDLVVIELNGPVRVIENRSAGAVPGSAIAIRLIDSVHPGNLRGIGARIDVAGPDGARLARRWVIGGGPFQSTASREVHVGIPESMRSTPLTITVRWPDGVTQSAEARAGERLTVKR